MNVDGNVYRTIKIGNQVWMAENLRTTRFNNGSPILLATDSTPASDTTPNYCFYNNTKDKDTIRKFGALYNWYAVKTGNLAPAGWHVPSYDELRTMDIYLIQNGYNWDGTTENTYGDSINIYARIQLAQLVYWLGFQD
jgi:uncharacterized protein (TIGR02145 family)